MSSVKNGKKKDIKIILLGILVGLVVCGAGIYGVVSSRIASHEYKNSTDIREVSAVVGYCREVVNKDKDEDGYHRERELREYRVKVTFEIDGETYQDRDTVYCWNDEEINTGDEIDVEVYRTSKGKYKIAPDRDPLEFLFCCVAIILGAGFAAIFIAEMFKKEPENGEESEKKKNKDKKRATNEMVALIVLNASSVQLVPTSIIALRAAAGSADPAGITGVMLLATLATTLVGAVLCRVLSK